MSVLFGIISEGSLWGYEEAGTFATCAWKYHPENDALSSKFLCNQGGTFFCKGTGGTLYLIYEGSLLTSFPCDFDPCFFDSYGTCFLGSKGSFLEIAPDLSKATRTFSPRIAFEGEYYWDVSLRKHLHGASLPFGTYLKKKRYTWEEEFSIIEDNPFYFCGSERVLVYDNTLFKVYDLEGNCQGSLSIKIQEPGFELEDNFFVMSWFEGTADGTIYKIDETSISVVASAECYKGGTSRGCFFDGSKVWANSFIALQAFSIDLATCYGTIEFSSYCYSSPFSSPYLARSRYENRIWENLLFSFLTRETSGEADRRVRMYEKNLSGIGQIRWTTDNQNIQDISVVFDKENGFVYHQASVSGAAHPLILKRHALDGYTISTVATFRARPVSCYSIWLLCKQEDWHQVTDGTMGSLYIINTETFESTTVPFSIPVSSGSWYISCAAFERQGQQIYVSVYTGACGSIYKIDLSGNKIFSFATTEPYQEMRPYSIVISSEDYIWTNWYYTVNAATRFCIVISSQGSYLGSFNRGYMAHVQGETGSVWFRPIFEYSPVLSAFTGGVEKRLLSDIGSSLGSKLQEDLEYFSDSMSSLPIDGTVYVFERHCYIWALDLNLGDLGYHRPYTLYGYALFDPDGSQSLRINRLSPPPTYSYLSDSAIFESKLTKEIQKIKESSFLFEEVFFSETEQVRKDLIQISEQFATLLSQAFHKSLSEAQNLADVLAFLFSKRASEIVEILESASSFISVSKEEILQIQEALRVGNLFSLKDSLALSEIIQIVLQNQEYLFETLGLTESILTEVEGERKVHWYETSLSLFKTDWLGTLQTPGKILMMSQETFKLNPKIKRRINQISQNSLMSDLQKFKNQPFGNLTLRTVKPELNWLLEAHFQNSEDGTFMVPYNQINYKATEAAPLGTAGKPVFLSFLRNYGLKHGKPNSVLFLYGLPFLFSVYQTSQDFTKFSFSFLFKSGSICNYFNLPSNLVSGLPFEAAHFTFSLKKNGSEVLAAAKEVSWTSEHPIIAFKVLGSETYDKFFWKRYKSQLRIKANFSPPQSEWFQNGSKFEATLQWKKIDATFSIYLPSMKLVSEPPSLGKKEPFFHDLVFETLESPILVLK